jgi:hypothetical protein
LRAGLRTIDHAETRSAERGVPSIATRHSPCFGRVMTVGRRRARTSPRRASATAVNLGSQWETTMPTMVREGVLVGLAGAAAVAIWFLIYDLAAGVPLRTPALLGAALFEGLRDPSALVITPMLVLKYTVVHGLAFIAFGIAAAGLFALADRERRVLFGAFMLFCCFEVAFVLAVAVLAGWLLEEVPLWTILAANLVAAVVMVSILFRRHQHMPQEILSTGE